MCKLPPNIYSSQPKTTGSYYIFETGEAPSRGMPSRSSDENAIRGVGVISSPLTIFGFNTINIQQHLYIKKQTSCRPTPNHRNSLTDVFSKQSYRNRHMRT